MDFDQLTLFEKHDLLEINGTHLFSYTDSQYLISLYDVKGILIQRKYNIETGVFESVDRTSYASLDDYLDNMPLEPMSR